MITAADMSVLIDVFGADSQFGAAGKRDRVIADFLIGAHAAKQCDRLLTRDRGYYKKYFGGLVIVDASA